MAICDRKGLLDVRLVSLFMIYVFQLNTHGYIFKGIAQ